MNTTTKYQEDSKLLVKLIAYSAIWVLFAISLYHLVTK
jgi:hypothetical protein